MVAAALPSGFANILSSQQKKIVIDNGYVPFARQAFRHVR
jgi:hypothetical protein